MISSKNLKLGFIGAIFILFLNSCNGKLPGGDARKSPKDPEKRIAQNLKDGKGFRINDAFNKSRGGVFEFASSNELWRASLDTIDFMPLSSVNYSGGIIITDWYSNEQNSKESIKISIRFLTNEIRSDSLSIKIFKKTCSNDLINCTTLETGGDLINELKTKILKTATLYQSEKKKKKDK